MEGQGRVENRVTDIEGMPADEVGTPGIIVLDGAQAQIQPRISAFVWGGKVRPVPTLPFGRWKKSA